MQPQRRLCWQVERDGARVTIECNGLLFDMDGVLISSVASADRCWPLWAKHYGLPGWEAMRIPHGVRAVDIIRMWVPAFKDLPVDSPEVREGLRLIEDMEIADVADLKVLPGVRELLASLDPARWTIVTSASKRLLVGRLQAANLPFPDKIITADDVTKGKPDPEPYRKGAELLGFTPASCVVVEDAPSGVGAGRAAGCKVMGVLGTHDAEVLKKAGADWVLASLAGLKVEAAGSGLRLEFEPV